MNILLVEDDVNLALGVEYALKAEGFCVSGARNLEQARAFLKQEFDLVLLDVALPDGTGYQLCSEIRQSSSVPVIFLTACDEEVNVVMGLDMGGDDYITKPFRLKELVSRIKAVGRRSVKNATDKGCMLLSGGITVNTLLSRVYRSEDDIQLTSLEYKLLLTFLSNPRQILSRNRLLEVLWDIDGEFVDDNALSVYIRRLREKIEVYADRPELIVTVRGSGYKWNEEVRRT